MKQLIVILLLFKAMNISAQWQADVRLTNNPAGSFTSGYNEWSVAANGNVVHVVWCDNRDGSFEIYYKRSTDAGMHWGADTRLTNILYHSNHPSVAVSGSVVHVVYGDNRDGNEEIYYKRSSDSGVSWGPDTRLTNDTTISAMPSVAVSGSVLHVVWYDERNGYNGEIYYKRSTDAGVSWGPDTRLTNNTANSYNPSVAVSGSVVHVAWTDNRDGNYEIYYKRSTDGGVSMGADVRMTNNNAESWNPSVTVSGSVVHIAWTDNRDGNYEIYYKRSTDTGVNWGVDVRMTNNTAYSENPSVTVSGSVVHVVWEDNRDLNNEIYYLRSTDAGVSWGTDTRLTNNTANSYNPSIAVSGSVVHIAWTDNRDGNYEIYYKRNPTGNVGVQNIATEVPSSFSLSQNYPNPFNPETKIQFCIPMDSRFRGNDNVVLKVYNALGREIETLVNEALQPGTYEVTFNGSRYNSGVYFYRLQAGNFSETRRMLLIK
jgi:hypothetical protein